MSTHQREVPSGAFVLQGLDVVQWLEEQEETGAGLDSLPAAWKNGSTPCRTLWLTHLPYSHCRVRRRHSTRGCQRRGAWAFGFAPRKRRRSLPWPIGSFASAVRAVVLSLVGCTVSGAMWPSMPKANTPRTAGHGEGDVVAGRSHSIGRLRPECRGGAASIGNWTPAWASVHGL